MFHFYSNLTTCLIPQKLLNFKRGTAGVSFFVQLNICIDFASNHSSMDIWTLLTQVQTVM